MSDEAWLTLLWPGSYRAAGPAGDNALPPARGARAQLSHPVQADERVLPNLRVASVSNRRAFAKTSCLKRNKRTEVWLTHNATTSL
jgi:hypothetical protein